MTRQPHPFANIFPMMEGEEFDAFALNCKEKGIREKIVLLDDLILDGRNRYAAAQLHDLPAAHDDPTFFRVFDPATEGDPLEWVMLQNLQRRHLKKSQLAMVGAKYATFRHGGDRKSDQAAKLPLDPSPSPSAPVTQKQAAAAVGVSERTLRDANKVQQHGTPELNTAVERGFLDVAEAAKVATKPTEVQAEVVRLAEEGKGNAARTAIKKAERVEREAALAAKQRALPDAKFGVIYADPEWRFKAYSQETGMDRAADNHYPTSTTEEIMARGVPSIAAEDSVIFLWATAPMLPDALRVMEAWGFAYKTHAIWHKLRNGDARGSGYWFTGEHELLLVGTRGAIPAPAPGTQWRSVIAAPVGEHSEKPDVFAQMIEGYYPTLPKIELNARGPRAGWEVWGNEAPEVELSALDKVRATEGLPTIAQLVERGELEPLHPVTANPLPVELDEQAVEDLLAQEPALASGDSNARALARLMRSPGFQIDESAGNAAPPAENAPPVEDSVNTITAQFIKTPTWPAPRPEMPEIPAFLLRTKPEEGGG